MIIFKFTRSLGRDFEVGAYFEIKLSGCRRSDEKPKLPSENPT
jgi:hypothetical protein